MKVKAREVIEQTQQNIKRRWKFIEGKERPIVYIGMALAFILSVVFIFVIYNAICEKHTLQMKFDSEKSFNTVYMAMDDNPSKIALAIRIARRTLRIARQNVGFAIGVKIAVLLLAAFGFATMWMAVFADVGVALLCVLNALRTMKIR